MNSRYYLAAADMGAVPVMIPLFDRDEATLRAVYDRLDGVLLAGGVDMEPATFGETPHPRLGRTDPARDLVELKLARWAIAEAKPLLGLCRARYWKLAGDMAGRLQDRVAVEGWPPDAGEDLEGLQDLFEEDDEGGR